MSMPLATDAWPPPLAHCGSPLVGPGDDRVTIAEISDEPVSGYKGTRMVYTALVPMEDLDAVMTTVDGLGQGIRTISEDRSFDEKGAHTPTFWICGLQGTKRYESLINSWTNGIKEILLPDSDFLMHFKLFPRFLDDEVAWDDYSLPLHDVVRSTPVSHYDFRSGRSGARITVRRDYLDRYLAYKNCAAVATYFDERYSTGDDAVETLIKAGVYDSKQPGRKLWFKRIHHLEYEQLSQVWGTALLMKPSSSSSYRQEPPELKWPDRAEPVKADLQDEFKPMETVFVKDEVLIAYEDRPEYEIHAATGSVGYGDRWSVSFCHRVGRNHIEIELRKLYEGSPSEVIVHFHKFAVAGVVARKDQQTNGRRNVGDRAKELIYAYLELTKTVAELAASVGVSTNQLAMCKYDVESVEYKGWWSFPGLVRLGNVIPFGMTRAAFLERCKDIFSILDDLQQAPLRQLTAALGLDKDTLKDFKSLKLLAAVCQMATIGIDTGLNFVDDATTVAQSWTSTFPISQFDTIFALQLLRVTGAHNLTGKRRVEYLKALQTFGINEKDCVNGWGAALDKVYDTLISSCKQLNELLIRAWVQTG
jgi:hypothetical protein